MRSQRSHFNPRAPCGARQPSPRPPSLGREFQPTRPLRGATDANGGFIAIHLIFQPTRPLRGATIWRDTKCCAKKFQPTRPLRGATNNRQMIFTLHLISTHAPLAGRDCNILRGFLRSRNFNPRAPCGARLGATGNPAAEDTEFQPTRPLRGATSQSKFADKSSNISTHAPLAGRDGGGYGERCPR